jgi:glycosyltransferase involved in cell wall biosynthesis
LIIISIPSFFLGFVGPTMRLLRGSEYVLDVRDLYPASLKEVGIIQEGVVYRLLKKAEAWLYRQARLVSIVNETWQPAIAKHAREIVVVPNGVDLDQLPFRKATPPSLTAQQKELLASRFVVVYIGNMGTFYDFDPFLSAATDIGQADVKDILFLFVGEGSQRTELENRIKAQTVENCVVWDPIPTEFLMSFLGLCQVGIVGWRENTRFLENGVPNKVYEYLAADLDVIACIPGTLPEILTESGQVHQFANQDRAGIVAKILEIRKRGGKTRTPVDLLATFSRKRHFTQLWRHILQEDKS